MNDNELPKSVLKALPTGWAEEADAMSEADLRAAIVEADSNMRTVEQEKRADEKLNAAKEIAKDLGAGYRDAIRCQRAKISYALHVLDSQGKL